MKKCGVNISPFVAVIRYTFDLIKRLPYEQRYLSSLLAFTKSLASFVKIKLEK